MTRASTINFFYLFFGLGISLNLHAFSIEYHKSLILPVDLKFQGTQIGGLSGITKANDLYWAISDDKGQKGEPRLYAFDVKLTEEDFSVKPNQVLFLKDKSKRPFLHRVLDFEGISFTGSDFLIVSEGMLNRKPRELPSLFQFSANGILKNELSLPARYLSELTGKQTKGTRLNGAFEGLSLSPSGDYLWLATELPLVQESGDWKLGKSGFTKILRYKKNQKSQWIFDTEWSYPIDAVSSPNQEKGPIVLAQGCSEILSLSDEELLVLERGVYTSGTHINYDLKLYKVSIVKGKNTNSSPIVNKEPVFDFSTIKDKFSDGRGLDNLEGMTWGPIINNQKTLLLISDDNFTPLQRTVWVALRIK